MARTQKKKHKVPENPALTYLLVFTLVFEVLVAVWFFVHFGAGTSHIAVKRFAPGVAETMMAVAASTAAFAWFSVFRKRWAAYGLFTGILLSLIGIWVSPPVAEGLKGPIFANTEALPGFLVPVFVGTSAVVGVLLFVLISKEWHGFERR